MDLNELYNQNKKAINFASFNAHPFGLS